jgi:hypothetical protein
MTSAKPPIPRRDIERKWPYGRDRSGNDLNVADVLENDAPGIFRENSVDIRKDDRN